MKLANQRASVVFEALKKDYPEISFRPQLWGKFSEMHSEANIRDIDEEVGKRQALEALNRRALLEVRLPLECLTK